MWIVLNISVLYHFNNKITGRKVPNLTEKFSNHANKKGKIITENRFNKLDSVFSVDVKLQHVTHVKYTDTLSTDIYIEVKPWIGGCEDVLRCNWWKPSRTTHLWPKKQNAIKTRFNKWNWIKQEMKLSWRDYLSGMKMRLHMRQIRVGNRKCPPCKIDHFPAFLHVEIK